MSDTLGYCLHPTLHGDTIVFTAEDNLWSVPVGGGDARRLTSSSARHSYPRFSPDGEWLAFSSGDEGPSAVYVMPAKGGAVRRLTYHGSADSVVGWTPDGKCVVFKTSATQGTRAFHLAVVPFEGGAVTTLPYGRADSIAFHDDGDTIAVGRHGQDPAWWKRYSGGRAGRLWLGSQKTGEFTRVPGGPRTDGCPMWIDGDLWFLSDQDGGGDLWVANADGSERRRVTNHGEFFARWPTAHEGRIVYTMGGALYLLDTRAPDPRPVEVPVAVRGHSQAAARKFVPVARSYESLDLSPDGGRLALTSRGAAVTVPCWHGAPAISAIPGTRFRLASHLDDDGTLVAVADHDGEERVVVLPPEGVADQADGLRTLTSLDRRARSLHPSPDGRFVAVLDQARGLHVIEVGSGEVVHFDDTGNHWRRYAAWSPCSTWLAVTRTESWNVQELQLLDTTTWEAHAVGTGEFSDYAPAWDPEGRYLAFLSNRHFTPFYDDTDFDIGFPVTTRAYLTMLREDEPVPFAPDVAAPKSDKGGNGPGDPDGGDKPDDDKAPKRIEIDVEGLADRTVALPFPVGRHVDVLAAKGGVAVLEMPLAGVVEEGKAAAKGLADARGTLQFHSFDARKTDSLADGVSDVGVSRDGKKWLVRSGHTVRVVDAGSKVDSKPAPASSQSGIVDLGRVSVPVFPREEFRQIYLEAWRLQRDHFYDPELVQVDWAACRDRYLPVLERVRTRTELSDLLWELQGELGTSHAYSMGGDLGGGRNLSVGLLGCDWELDEATGRYRVGAVHRGDVWAEGQHAPLAEPGRRVRAGEYLLAVDGRRVDRDTPPGEALLDRVGKPVTLTVAADAEGSESRSVVVHPIANEDPLRYRSWVQANAAYVREQTNGRVGYLHIPNMGLDGALEFARGFRWQVDKYEGLVVDNRFNGGGHLSSVFLSKLGRKIIGWCESRWGAANTYPEHTIRGPVAVLTNENAGSDGDIFSAAVKSSGLGPLIGMRTWGGVVGIDSSKPLVDGGLTTQPEYAFWFPETGFGVENHGVDPDIVVDRTPGDAFAGRDPQLDRGIAHILRGLEENPVGPPDFGPKPNLRWTASEES